MKNFIKNKKVQVTFISCLVVVILVLIGISAMNMVAKDSSIGTEAAKKFALLDAGVKEKSVKHMDVQFTYKDSTYVYDVKFDTEKKDYSYFVKASNGVILEKKIVKKKASSKKKEKKSSDKKKSKKSKNKDKSSEESSKHKKIQDTTKKVKSKSKYDDEDEDDDAENVIGMDEAKSIAISASGASPGDVVFTMAVLSGDAYNLQFYDSNTEYNYSIDAFSGSVMSASSNNIGG